MAFRIRNIRVRVRKAILAALRKIRVIKPTRPQAQMSARPKMFLEAKGMNIRNLNQQIAQEFADDLKAIIERQLIAWVPLSPTYAQRKRMLGLDPRILIATGRYVNSIQPIEQPDGSWVVSVPDEPLRDGSKHTLKDLARWLEYGTRHMPARPHWRPAMNIWRTKIYQVRRRVRHDLVQELKKAGYR